MNETHSRMTQRLAEMASSLQQQRTGLAPKAVTVILSEDTLVMTLRDADLICVPPRTRHMPWKEQMVHSMDRALRCRTPGVGRELLAQLHSSETIGAPCKLTRKAND